MAINYVFFTTISVYALISTLFPLCASGAKIKSGASAPPGARLFHFENQSGAVGYMNSQGEVVIPAQFASFYDFESGVAPVKKIGGKSGLIDKQGNFLLEPKWAFVSEVSRGTAYAIGDGAKNTFTILKRQKQGFMQTAKVSGNPLKIDNGLIIYYTGSGSRRRFGVVDQQGKVVYEPKWDYIGSFHEGLACAIDSMGKTKFLTLRGDVAISTPFSSVSAGFGSGLAPVQKKKGLWGYINRFGEVEIGFEYTDAMRFTENMAGVAIEKDYHRRFGFIDMKGYWKIEPKYVRVKPFQEGLAAVKTSNKDSQSLWGYIDHSGEFVIEPMFTSADSFEDGLAEVRTGGVEGYIDRQGRWVRKWNVRIDE